MSRIAVYKPPRSSPLAGPAISVNIDDDDEDEEGGDDGAGSESPRNEKSRTTLSRLPSPYPTPPRTPSPSSDYSKDDSENATIVTPEIRVWSTESSSGTWSKAQTKQLRSVGNVDASSRLLTGHQDVGRSTPRSSSHSYVRTPFSAPPTMPDFHPSYNTNATSVRAVQRPRTAPGSSSSKTSTTFTSYTSYAVPGERGTFSAPGIIRSTATPGRNEMPNRQSKSSRDCKAPKSSSSNRYSCLDTSSNPKLNWITASASKSSPPPFSRTPLTQSVVMPVKAIEAEAKRSTRRSKTTPNLRMQSTSALSRFQVQEVNMSQPVPISKSSEEERYQPGPISLSSPDGNAHDRHMSKEAGNKVHGPGNGQVSSLRDNEYEKAGFEELATEEHRNGAGKWKWKLLLKKKLGKTNL